MDDFKIASALINFYKRRLISDEDKQLDIAQKMKALHSKKNHLESEIEKLKINSKLFEEINASTISDLPKIEDLNQIRDNITLV